jgi:hypothetical protein
MPCQKPGVRTLAAFLLMTAMTCCSRVTRADPERLALIYMYRVHEAEMQFCLTTGRYGNLRELGPEGAHLISRELAKDAHSSYRFTLSLTDASYAIRARPLRWGGFTRRSFYSDQTGVVHQNSTDGDATDQSAIVY